jgi:MFS family permease
MLGASARPDATRVVGLDSRGWQLFLLTFTVTAAAYAGTTLGPLQEAAKAALSLTDRQMALLQGPALAIPTVVLAIPLGLIADRSTRVQIVRVFAVCDLLATVLTAGALSFASLFVYRAVIGLATTAVNPVALSLIGDLYPEHQRGRAVMSMGLGQTVGAAAAFAAGGGLLQLTNAFPGQWRTVMLWLAAPLLTAIVAALRMKEPRRSSIVIARPTVRQTMRELSSYRRALTPLIAAIVLIQIALGALLVWTVPTLTRRFAMEPNRVGFLMATAMLVSGLLGPAAGGWLADYGQRRGGPRRTVLMIVMLSALMVPAAAFGIAPNALTAAVLLVIFASLVTATSIMGTTLLTIVVPNELRGVSAGVFSAVSVLFSVGVAPVLVSELAEQQGGEAAIGNALTWVCLASTGLAGVIFLTTLAHFSSLRREAPSND